MKVIFLDFDGVITTPFSDYCLSKHHIGIINYICRETGAKLVLSTSWRSSTLEQTIENITLKNPYIAGNPFPLTNLIVGVTPIFGYSTRRDYVNPRPLEIKQYLDEHDDIENYVIIDDDNLDISEDNPLKPHIFYTNHFEGITFYDAKKIISFLNEQS